MKIKAFKSILMIMFVVVIMSMMSISAFAQTYSASATDLTGTEKQIQQALAGAYPDFKTNFSVIKEGACKYPVELIINGSPITVYLDKEQTSNNNTGESGDIGNIDVTIGDDGHLNVGGIGDEAPWKTVIAKFKGVIAGITGVCTMIMIVLFILAFMKLGSSAGNPTQRTQALVGILWTGVATALLGSVTIWIGFFYNAL